MKNQNAGFIFHNMHSAGFILYTIFIRCYVLALRLASPFNSKAKQWLEGRKDVLPVIAQKLKGKTGRRIWMHCASLGEFEQGRPVLEKWKQLYPSDIIILTFFSPSGYALQKNYSGADVISYLPMDGKRNARQFIEITHPQLALFVKYEFWYHYLKTLHRQNIPVILFSSIFRQGQIFFKWYGSFYRNMLAFYSGIFVQNTHSQQLLQSIHYASEVAPDTRFDRVIAISKKNSSDEKILAFVKSSPILIGGSTWPADEKIILHVFKTYLQPQGFKLILAPHDVSNSNIQRLQNIIGDACTLYSGGFSIEKSILILNTMGKLSEIYRYAKYVFVGGAFGKGLHNILEATVYGKPVFFGPAFSKFNEAINLNNAGAAFPVNDASQMETIIRNLEDDTAAYDSVCKIASDYVEENIGGTKRIYNAMEKLLG